MATQTEQKAFLAELRQELERIRVAIAAGATGEALLQIDATLLEIAPARLLTIAEAAEVLHIRTAWIVAILLREEGAALIERGDETLVPLAEVERLYANERVALIRASDRVHDMLEDFGPKEGLTEEQLEDLHNSRPGTLPWERQ